MFHVEQSDSWGEYFISGAAELGLALGHEVIEQCRTYASELIYWNQKTNLTAIKDEKEVIVKHFLDSLACSQALGSLINPSLLDVGSGAGFPGLPLKILHPELDLTLLEPSAKKTAFLRHTIGTLGLSKAIAISQRLEDFSRDATRHHRFSCIVTRALKMENVVPYTGPLLKPGGRLILCRTVPLGEGKGLMGFRVAREISYQLPGGFGGRVLTVLERAA